MAPNCRFEDIAAYHNIRLAFLKAIRGKRSSSEVTLFCGNIDRNLRTIRDRLNAGNIKWGSCRSFIITDPKRRIISAAPIEDRIIHHAIMNILEPLFERQMMYHTHAAVQYAFSKSKGFPWFLKLDVRKYFDSIGHAVVKRLLTRLVKDKNIRCLLFSIIDSYETAPDRGLPIGNLTSQFFANLYLSSLDHYILEQVKPCAYIRYYGRLCALGPEQGIFEGSLAPRQGLYGAPAERTAQRACFWQDGLGAALSGLFDKAARYIPAPHVKAENDTAHRGDKKRIGWGYYRRSRRGADKQRVRGGAVCTDPAVPGKVMVWERLGKQSLRARTGSPGAPPRTGERVLAGTTMRPTARLPTGTTPTLTIGAITLVSGWPAPESREGVSLC
ncbi:MAG: RNA-directed DNA polymerase [Treponema sp.]|jgi:hypothetical protein|nr:RNA-directed DNA polymerase [Treponema sp.]